MKDGTIPDSAITASQTLLDAGFQPAHIRLLDRWENGDALSDVYSPADSWIQVGHYQHRLSATLGHDSSVDANMPGLLNVTCTDFLPA